MKLAFFWVLGCRENQSSAPDVITENISAYADAGENFSVELGQFASFSAGESQGVSFSWNFGDGETSEETDVEHLFDEVGRYQAVLTAVAADGTRDADAVSVTVHHPLTPIQPMSSSSLIIAEDALWTIVEEAGILTKIDLETQETHIFPTCESPRSLAYQNGLVAITCAVEASVTFFDTQTETFSTQFLPPNSLPNGIVGRDNRWWIALSATGELAELSSETIIHPIGTDLRGISLLADGRIALPRWRSAPTGAEIYLWDGESVDTIHLDIDRGGDSDNTTGGLPNLLDNIYPSLDGGTILAPFSHANILRGEYRNGQALTHETSLRAILGFIETESQEEDPEQRKHFDERGRVSAIGWSPLGDILYALHPATGTITVLDAYNKQIMSSILNIGNMPIDLKLSADGTTLFVYVWLDREIVAYNVQNTAQISEEWRQSVVDEEPLSESLLRGKQLFHSASDLRLTRSGYISCANCHPDGSHDGQTWDFTDRGEGLRNTSSLLGRAGMGMGRLHWSGNFDEVQDFEGDIRRDFAGTGLLSDEEWEQTADPLGESKSGISTDLDALAAYVTSLSELPQSPYETDEIGEQNFYMLGCADCHPAPLYTDSNTLIPRRHDIGTIEESSGYRLQEELDGLDTPTLLGLWRSAPYLHDGRAQSISEAVQAHAGFEDLSPEILTSIEHFLRSL